MKSLSAQLGLKFYFYMVLFLGGITECFKIDLPSELVCKGLQDAVDGALISTHPDDVLPLQSMHFRVVGVEKADDEPVV